MKGFYNALTFDSNILKCAGSKSCSRINYVGEAQLESVNIFTPIERALGGESGVFLSSLENYDLTDKALEMAASGSKLMISCSQTLDEVGKCDKKFGMTPVGLAHQLGLLDGALVCGANYLDKDDVLLIIQSGAKVILTPSTSMGSGFGIPPLRMLLSLGATVHLGTGDFAYNRQANLEFEAKLISLAVSGALCTKDAVSPSEIKKLLR